MIEELVRKFKENENELNECVENIENYIRFLLLFF
jgi:hypothetical protein